MHKSVDHMKTKQLAMLYTLLFVVGVSFFLRKETQKTTYKPTYAQVPTSPIQFVEVEENLVAGFPTIPIYPRAEIDDSYRKTVRNEKGYEAEWYTTDSVKQVLEFYREALPQDGWVLDFIPENFDAYETQYEAHKGNQKLYLMIEVAETNNNLTEIVAEFPLQ